MKEIKLLSWNVAGIRSVVKKGFLDLLKKEAPYAFCAQETKANLEQIPQELKNPEGYQTYWNSHPERKGYSGVGLFTQEEPDNVRYDFNGESIAIEGRLIISEYPAFTLFNVYFPNGKAGPERLAYKMKFYDVFLKYADTLVKKGNKLVICGDVNTAHTEIDIARPKENSKVSGFLPQERAWIDKFISHGYVDTFRHFNREPGQYSWWDIKTGARARNVGWRIDYFFISENLLPALTGASIMDRVMGSDHCPVGITLKV